MVQVIQWAAGLGLLPYALAVAMPSWRWLLGCVIFAGGPLAALWIQHFIAAATPGYKEGPGGFIGIFIFGVITIAFTAGVGVRAATLALTAAGWSLKRAFWFNVAGFGCYIAVFAVPYGWQEWRLRPPSAECAQSVFDVELAGVRLALPAAPIFNVYLGRTSSSDAYYLGLKPSLRDFCARNDNGKQRVHATNLWIRFERAWGLDRAMCEGQVAPWAGKLCAAVAATDLRQTNTADFPLEAHVFSPDEVILGQFGGSRSTYEDLLAGRAMMSRPIFIKSERLTPDGKPLTFVCMDSNERYYCRASYPWLSGATLDYTFRAEKENVAERGLRIDDAAQAFVRALMVK